MNCRINIDKLIYSFQFNHKLDDYLNDKHGIDFEFFTLIRNTHLNSNYKNNFDIILSDNTNFGLLQWGSFNFNKQKMYISVNNQILYSNKLKMILDIISRLNLEFDCVSRLDIALDCDRNIVSKFYSLLKNKDLEFIILNKKINKDDEIKHLLNLSVGSCNNIHKNKSFYLSNKEKGLVLACYNKLKEIQDNNFEKQYIIDSLNLKNIYRLEIRTNHKLLLDTLNKLGFTDLYLFNIINDNLHYELYLLFKELLGRLIRISHNNKTYSLLDFIS